MYLFLPFKEDERGEDQMLGEKRSFLKSWVVVVQSFSSEKIGEPFIKFKITFGSRFCKNSRAMIKKEMVNTMWRGHLPRLLG